jgi:Tfp pilus assembly protein PilN
MRSINLLPKDAQRDVRLQFVAKQLLMFWIWVLISVIAFLVLTLVARIYLAQQKTGIESAISQQRETLKSSNNELLKQQVSSINSQTATIKNLSGQHYYWAEAFVDLANRIPADMQADLISLDRTTGKVEIQGMSGTRSSVLQFWSNMHKSAFFKDIDFPLSNLDQATNDSYTFTFYLNPDQLKQE